MRDSFVFYKSFYEAIAELPTENQLEIYDAICRYSLFGEVPEMSSVAKAMFTLMKANIDASAKKYRASVENGKKGGRPKKDVTENPAETQPKAIENPAETQPKANDNLNDNVNDNDNVNENKDEKKKEKKRTNASKPASYDEILSNSVSDDSLKELYHEYIKMRKLIKAPMTDRALTILISKVNQLEPNDVERQKRLLETSIANNWKSVYPLKDEPKPQKSVGFDLDEFFDAACLDSERKRIENPPKTAADDETIRKRAEALKNEFSTR